MKFQYKKHTHFKYEIHKTPFFGGKPQLTINALKKIKKEYHKEEYFLEILEKEYLEVFKAIEWVRFYQYNWPLNGKKQFKMRRAVVNLAPIPHIRKFLYKQRDEITIKTSWYPLVMGSRAWFNTQAWNNENRLSSIGKLQKIIPLENTNRKKGTEYYIDGSSFEIVGNNGKVLLDFGKQGNEASDNYKYLFLSHYHGDHSGGVDKVIKKNPKTPVIASKTTFLYLNHLPYLSDEIKRNLRKNAHLPVKIGDLTFEDNSQLQFFPVFHTPGSYGIKIIDSENKHFTYLGDVCLKNGFLNFWNEVNDIIIKNKGTKNYLLLDCAMIRGISNFDEGDVPGDIFSEITKDVKKRNIIILSNQIENQIYSYMLAFSSSSKNEELRAYNFILSETLYHQTRTLLEPFALNEQNYKDPFADKIIGKSKMNFIESQRLYPLNEQVVNSLNNENAIYFINDVDLKKHYLKNKIKIRDHFILTGRYAIRENLPKELQKLKARMIWRVASEDWNFHSNVKDLVKFIQELNSQNVKVILFHQPFRKLIEFINNNNLNKRMVWVLGNKEYYFR